MMTTFASSRPMPPPFESPAVGDPPSRPRLTLRFEGRSGRSPSATKRGVTPSLGLARQDQCVVVGRVSEPAEQFEPGRGQLATDAFTAELGAYLGTHLFAAGELDG